MSHLTPEYPVAQEHCPSSSEQTEEESTVPGRLQEHSEKKKHIVQL